MGNLTDMTRKFTKYPTNSIKASNMGINYDVINAYLSDDDIYDTLYPFEKKILAKAANSIDFQVYLAGAIEALNLAKVSVSPTFEKVTEMLIENWDFDRQRKIMGL